MVLYKDGNLFEQSQSTIFDKLYSPGEQVPFSGIYRCEGCQKEIASNALPGDKFPPQDRHKHTPDQGKILWRLVARTQP